MKTVYLSPSTQEHNVGVNNYGTEEKRMNEVADVVERILENHGVKIYRNKPQWSLSKAVKNSNTIKPDLHFAIHSNAGGGRGCEVYAYGPGGARENAAKSIYREMERITPSKDRGIKFNPKFYELKSTKAPAVLVEVAFHDNVEDAKWILDNIERIGVALSKGVLKHFGIKYIEAQNDNKEDITKLLKEAVHLINRAEEALRKVK